ncbi:hypothetical protein ACFU9F_20125 [Streptomyces zhihengii]|uniref:DUF4064 domain-containing protein n=1 Tax=Streptomyces zhihengii TaxID=1818004 RepID=A0ABS2UQL0_9ACTN|nr:hypothetical protein [Streptomyces zhihengii]MBM9619831.1 hypothetical protein [Streptomyces zhihengii]
MSFGDPNNPYAQQGQPQGQQPGYGYPQAPPVQPYGGGYPTGPVEMPGAVKAARIFLYVIVVCQVIVAGIYGYSISEFDKTTSELNGTDAEVFADLGKGVLGFLLGLSLVFAALGLALALKYASGGNGVRVCAIVYGSFAIVSGIFTIPVGLVTLIVAILLIVFAAKRDSAEWFKRPRH